MGEPSPAVFLARIVWARIQSRVCDEGVGFLEREAGQYLDQVSGDDRTDPWGGAKPLCEFTPIRCGLDELRDPTFDSFQDAVELAHELPSLIAQALTGRGSELYDGISPQQKLAQLMLLAARRLVGVQVGRFGADISRDQGRIGTIGLAALANRLGVLMNPARVHHEDRVTALGELAGEQLMHLAGSLHAHQAASRQPPCEAIDRARVVVQAKRGLLLGTHPLNVDPFLADVASHDDSHLASLGFTLESAGV